MSFTVAINGFGRMGRLYFRTLWNSPNIKIVHINEPAGNAECSAHLLAFDSVHGKFLPEDISADKDQIIVENQIIRFTQNSDIGSTDWNQVDLLVDCSGQYRETNLFDEVFSQSVKKILVSCPVKDAGTLNIAYGINHQLYQSEKHHLITAASCTTNALAPVIQVLLDNFGIEQGSMTTIHADTPQPAIEQLSLLVLQAGSKLVRDDVRHYVRESVDLFVQLERRGGKRQIKQVLWRIE